MSRKEREEAERQFKRITPGLEAETRAYEARMPKVKPLREARMIKYKTVFQVVFENTERSAGVAEVKAVAQLKKLVGEKEANQIMSRNYPVTTEIGK